ncbi:hypothetical protein JG687_00012355 [Phytophthora cactorum]|uniref:Uncharacterized protein n=1 Tax=Phytophthora cactorum TaxID=29920 RepID=A0A329RTR5_9STRA|nr:hypothetical protein Pcac1_g11758 [Phytophthora cactorum]KAG2809589.1 hypothetical protein PC112_g16437 [Phytophthora cactorum]KAG2811169.1 hypothetical protein PC111_g15349 [Phytophthora cactorum]KAG2850764.1 hypothetical protein PC113_g16497 [Phytophthora cactorum]KAG2889224.1 hypothetical protein PC114_g18059 [Phytophthora cactorum]
MAERFHKRLLGLCLVLVVAWLTVLITTVLEFGWDVVISNTPFKIMTAVAASAALIGIDVDKYGLPVVDPTIPLSSFNMDIYMTYYRNALRIYTDLKETDLDNASRLTELNGIYNLPEKISTFYDIFKEQIRIAVVGAKCLVVERGMATIFSSIRTITKVH